MRKSLARKLGAVVAGAAILTTGTQVLANEGLYVGASGSAYHLDTDHFYGGSEDAYIAGLNLGYRFSNNFALEFGVGAEAYGDDMDIAKLDAIYWLNSNFGGWQPYVVGSIVYYELGDGDSYSLKPEQAYSQQVALGFGMSKMLTPQWEFRTDARILHKVHHTDSDNTDAALTFAANYYFNKPAPVVVTPPPAPVVVQAAPAPTVEKTHTVTQRLDVKFASDDAQTLIVPSEQMRSIASAMQAHDSIGLDLEGHTDSTGPEAYNQKLSERRANAVKNEFITTYGISSQRISTAGHGELRPIADNSTREGKRLNRRVMAELSYPVTTTD